MNRSCSFRAGKTLPPEAFHAVRLRTIFECCKWDPQVEDTSALAPYPILLPRLAWQELAQFAERLAAETIAAEKEILDRPELLKELALPRAIWKLLAGGPPSAPGPRVMRFDFHETTEGWRISEVNSDVPGGFVEGDGFTRLMSEACGGLPPADFPARRLAEALVQGRGAANSTVAFVHASAYSDDRQVPTFLAREAERLGARTVLVDPSQIRWGNDGSAEVVTEWFQGRADVMHRFFPAEWLPNLRRTCAWRRYFVGASTPQCNPGWALISQSKRFGMLLPRLSTELPAWQNLLPETRDVRAVARSEEKQWVFKPALGRVGEGIGIAGISPAKQWKEIRRHLFFFPGGWVAQRRFEMLPLNTELGPRYVCLGVYTVDGRAAGIYARTSASPVIDHTAQDVAVLLEEGANHVES